MTTPAVPAEESIRQAVNRWSEQSRFRIRYFGDKIFIDEMRPHDSYTVRLETQYEERSVGRATVPYTGGPVDEHGRPPGLWDLSVAAPAEFADRTEQVAVPHTESVGMCARCAGLGRVDCPLCHGTGRVTCTWCHGRGFREQQEAQQLRDASGKLTTQWVPRQVPCTCVGGQVSCTSCGGNGRKTCEGCAGGGRTKSYDLLTVRFRRAVSREVLDATDVPDDLVGAARGEVVADVREGRIETPPAVAPAPDARVAELLRTARAVDERSARILSQHLRVDRVAVHEVAYRYAGVGRRLWVYGAEQMVHAPGAPWLWQRAAAVVVAVLVALVAIMAILAKIF